MKNKYKIIGNIICALIILLVSGACEKKKQTPQKPKVVSRKVVSKKITKPASESVEKEKTESSDKEKKGSDVDVMPAARPEKQSTASEKTKKTDSSESKKISTTTLTTKKKSAFKPRSEISSEDDFKDISPSKVKVAKKVDTKTQQAPKESVTKKEDLTTKADNGKKTDSKKEDTKGEKLLKDKTVQKTAETKDKEGETLSKTGEKKEESSLEIEANKAEEEQEKSQMTAALQPSKSLKPVTITPLSSKFKYQPEGKIDPFSSLFKVQEESRNKRRKRTHVITPLEKEDISQYKLVGVILSAKGNKAIVQEASGKGYVVTRGTYIGVNEGRVVEILKDRIVCEEEVENLFGQIEIRSRSLILNKPPGAL